MDGWFHLISGGKWGGENADIWKGGKKMKGCSKNPFYTVTCTFFLLKYFNMTFYICGILHKLRVKVEFFSLSCAG